MLLLFWLVRKATRKTSLAEPPLSRCCWVPARCLRGAKDRKASCVSAQDSKPQCFTGTTAAQPLLPVPGEVFALRKLLPQTPDYDFNVHVMDFQPGEFLNVKVRLR